MRIEVVGLPGAGKSTLLKHQGLERIPHSLTFRLKNRFWRRTFRTGLHVPDSLSDDLQLVSGLNSLQLLRSDSLSEREFFRSFNHFLFSYSALNGKFPNEIWDDGYTQRIVSLTCSPYRVYTEQQEILAKSVLRPDVLISVHCSPRVAQSRLNHRGSLPSKFEGLSVDQIAHYLDNMNLSFSKIEESYTSLGTIVIHLESELSHAESSLILSRELSNLDLKTAPVVLRC